MAQLSESQLAITRDHPIGDALASFRHEFQSAHPRSSFRGGLDHFQQLVIQPERKTLVLRLMTTFLSLPATTQLIFDDGNPLASALAHLYGRLVSNQTDVKHTAQLVKSVVAVDTDSSIWAAVYDLIRQTRPAPPTFALPTAPSSVARPVTPQRAQSAFSKETPWIYKTSSHIASSIETMEDVDSLLEFEVEQNLIVDHPRVFDTFFGRGAELDDMATAVFDACTESDTPAYAADGAGWLDWPADNKQDDVLAFLRRRVEQFAALAAACGFAPPTQQRWCHSTPAKPSRGSIAKRKPDFCIVSREPAGEDVPSDWADVLVPGELKTEQGKDNHKRTRMQISGYAREVFASQDGRRFVLAFTLCGSVMRLWEFDRLGVLASESFDINTEGHKFVSVILGFFWMSEEDLGFDPTIHKDERGRYMEIERDGQVERIYVEPIVRPRSISGRGTTCWKGYMTDRPADALVVKDAWQLKEHPEEGLLLKDAVEAKVDNVARYYHHETVRIGDAVDDVLGNVRRGLDDAEGRRPNHQPRPTAPGVVTSRSSGLGRGAGGSKGVSQGRGRSKSKTEAESRKRSLSTVQDSNLPLPPKRARLDLASQKEGRRCNRVHRRVITRGAGKSLHKASSLQAMLTGLLGGLKGHESLFKAGILHRDISIGNVLLNQTEDDGFLIDLDLAIKVGRQNASGAPSKTGTKVFMAIGALYGEYHLNVFDKESFFWLLFWICVHWDGPDEELSESKFDTWNSENTEKLAREKIGLVLEEDGFDKEIHKSFTDYCKALIPCVLELRKVVFPGGRRRKSEDDTLYSQMRVVLERGRGSLSSTDLFAPLFSVSTFAEGPGSAMCKYCFWTESVTISIPIYHSRRFSTCLDLLRRHDVAN